MNLLIIGDYPVATQARMRAAFPTEWQITIAAPDACAPYLADAEVVIPEHVLVDDAFLAQAPRLRFVQVGAPARTTSILPLARVVGCRCAMLPDSMPTPSPSM